MANGSSTYVCPHCAKPFSATLLAPQTRRAGFKCPHCRLFVPLERADADEPSPVKAGEAGSAAVLPTRNL